MQQPESDGQRPFVPRRRLQSSPPLSSQAPDRDDVTSGRETYVQQSAGEPVPGVPPQDSGQDYSLDDVQDYWTCNDDFLIRVHNIPRQQMFRLTDDNRPFPFKFIDVMSHTRTDSDDEAHQRIETHRTDDDAGRDLGFEWTGRTYFEFLKHKPPKGKCWVQGELVRIKRGLRPGHVTPYFWQRSGPERQMEAWRIGQTKNQNEKQVEKKPRCWTIFQTTN